MANNPKYSNNAVNTKVDALGALLNNGYIRIYSGTQPVDADTAVGAQVLLAELRFSATAFDPGVAGSADAAAVTNDAAANATGTATWFRCLASNGTTVIFDGTVGTSGCDLNINNADIQVNTEVSVTSFTLVEQKG